jgi:hypothetical protein
MSEWVSAIAAVLAAVFAGAAWVVALPARADSRRSADASELAATAAADGVAIAKTEADRLTERSDVSWEFVDQADDRRWRVEYRNIGLTAARKVEAVLVIDGVRVDLQADRVPPGQSIRHDAHDLHQEAERRWLDGVEHGSLGSPGMEIEARIVWSSELGTPATWTGTDRA